MAFDDGAQRPWLSQLTYRSFARLSARHGASGSLSVSSIRLHHVMAALTASRACRERRPTRSPVGP